MSELSVILENPMVLPSSETCMNCMRLNETTAASNISRIFTTLPLLYFSKLFMSHWIRHYRLWRTL